MAVAAKKIHRKLIARLVIGWCVLSTLIGAVVYFLEIEKVDDFVVNLAIEESASFMHDSVDYINSTDRPHRSLLLERSREHIDKGHFIAVAFYNKERQKITGVGRPGFDESVLDRHERDFFSAGNVEYSTLYIDRRLSVHVFVPLKDHSGGIPGYFAGVYQADQKTMSVIKERIAASLIQVVVVVLATTVMLYPVIIALNRDLIGLSVDLSHANIGMLKALGSAVAKRDGDTNIHNYRVTLYAIRFAEAVGVGEDGVRSLIKGAFLHDVGKIGISDTILRKPGKLSADEFEVMKAHPRHGVDIIGKYAWLKDALDVVKHHHEKFDGSGYPSGLRGDAIPLNARIFTIADVFDALTSRRPYKEPLPLDRAMQLIKQDEGKHFEPKLLSVFGNIARTLYREISNAGDGALEETLDGFIRKYFYSS